MTGIYTDPMVSPDDIYDDEDIDEGRDWEAEEADRLADREVVEP